MNLIKYRQDRDLFDLIQRARDLSLTKVIVVPQKKSHKNKPSPQQRKEYALALAQLAYDVFKGKKGHNK